MQYDRLEHARTVRYIEAHVEAYISCLPTGALLRHEASSRSLKREGGRVEPGGSGAFKGPKDEGILVLTSRSIVQLHLQTGF